MLVKSTATVPGEDYCKKKYWYDIFLALSKYIWSKPPLKLWGFLNVFGSKQNFNFYDLNNRQSYCCNYPDPHTVLQNLEKKCHFNLGMPKWVFFSNGVCLRTSQIVFLPKLPVFHLFPIFSPPPEPPLIRNNFITIAHEGKDSIFWVLRAAAQWSFRNKKCDTNGFFLA